MIRPKSFIKTLDSLGIDFFAGVPDSLLKHLCSCLSDVVDKSHHIIAANEGGAIGLATGYHLATGKIPCVYLQNSGEGNIINPLSSLTDKDVYRIPILLIIGWRGKPGEHDEPQHVKQGKITTGLLNTLGIEYSILNKNEAIAEKQLEQAYYYMKENGEVYALVIEKDTFEPYDADFPPFQNTLVLKREESIEIVASSIGSKDVIVSTTGMISRELYECRVRKGKGHSADFLTVGSMGHASQIALGIALEKKDRNVWCFDGDGSTIMHMGALAIIGSTSPSNFIHVIFNNGAHDSVGGQPTAGMKIDFPGIAGACGYKYEASVDNKESLITCLKEIKGIQGPSLLEIKVKKGNRKDLGRPTTTPIQNKSDLMSFLKNS